MNTETHTSQPVKSNPTYNKRQYFIAFDPMSGKINKISTAPHDLKPGMTEAPCWNPICKRVIKGTASLKNYGMIWDVINNKWEFSERSTTLELVSRHNKLVPFEETTDPTASDIFVKIFYEDKKVLVEANRTNITSSKNLSDITEISTNENKLLDIYITKKNDPDYLIDSISVNPLELFQTGKQVTDLNEEITSQVDWSEISLYTKPVFKKYQWALEATLVKNQDFLGTRKILQSSNSVDNADININIVDNTLDIRSKLKEEHIYYFEGKNKLQIVVCDRHIDNLIGAIELPVGSLLQTKSYLNINFDWPNDPLLIFKNNYVTISTNGELNDTND